MSQGISKITGWARIYDRSSQEWETKVKRPLLMESLEDQREFSPNPKAVDSYCGFLSSEMVSREQCFKKSPSEWS